MLGFGKMHLPVSTICGMFWYLAVKFRVVEILILKQKSSQAFDPTRPLAPYKAP